MNQPLKSLTSPSIKTPHGFFTRRGGVSGGIYASLNASYGSDDLPANITENRRRIANHFNITPSHLLTLKQTHSNICHIITAPTDTINLIGDGLATKHHGIALGVLTADCAPVLLHDSQMNVIAAAHAGWKGALGDGNGGEGGIIEATINAMITLGAAPSNISAAIGASIAQASYEVEVAFADAYLRQNPTWQKFFAPAKQATHLLFDNKAFVAEKLAQLGVINIDIFPHDTYANSSDYFSFRRATHAGEKDYGRQISAIML